MAAAVVRRTRFLDREDGGGARFEALKAPTQLKRCVHCHFTFCSPLPPHLPACSLMSSGTFWSNACKNAGGRPVQTLLDAAFASCGVTVR